MKNVVLIPALALAISYCFSNNCIASEYHKDKKISELHPVIYDNFLLGGSDSSGWLQPEDIENKLDGNELYRLFYPDDLSMENIISVSCDWDCTPRIPTKLSNQNAKYKEVVSDVLKAIGLDEPVVNILQNYKIDLEDDGTDEVIIYAEYSPGKYYINGDSSLFYYDYDRFSTQKGSYSILILRKIINGSVENIILDYDVRTKSVEMENLDYRVRYIFEICGFFDLNGDGKMEIVTKWMYYEGIGYDVWEVSGDKANRVIGNGWGV